VAAEIEKVAPNSHGLQSPSADKFMSLDCSVGRGFLPLHYLKRGKGVLPIYKIHVHVREITVW
jgi:hypothetical protein